MNKYKQWMLSQDPKFIKEICGTQPVPDVFIDYNTRNITLQELERLDSEFITTAQGAEENKDE